MSFDHIQFGFRYSAALTNPKRYRLLKNPRWIGHSQADLVIDILTELMNRPHAHASNLVIVGNAKSGKTAILQRFFDLFGDPHSNDETQVIKPVIRAGLRPTNRLNPTPDEKGLYASILECFWCPYQINDPTAALRKQAIQSLRRVQCRILFVDDFQHFLKGTTAQRRKVVNAIRSLSDELAIPVVLTGTEETLSMLHTSPKQSLRFPVVRLPRMELNAEFQKWLANFESMLPLRKKSGLSHLPIALALLSISEGNLGSLRDFLIGCAKNAIKDGSEAITLNIIEASAAARRSTSSSPCENA